MGGAALQNSTHLTHLGVCNFFDGEVRYHSSLLQSWYTQQAVNCVPEFHDNFARL